MGIRKALEELSVAFDEEKEHQRRTLLEITEVLQRLEIKERELLDRLQAETDGHRAEKVKKTLILLQDQQKKGSQIRQALEEVVRSAS
ncbi:MAG: hypothetical protein HQL82_12085 [Magnetococcales bacterium]|nr:hypothetical protein [Magnetococcales bacterium]